MEGGGSGGSGSDDWCTIESDPGVFTALLEDLGVSGVELQELWSLEDDSVWMDLGSTVYGLIFLFQWQQPQQTDDNATRSPLSEMDIPPNLFFAHQVTTNACATQAILSVLFNAASLTDEQKGPILAEFQSFTNEFPPSLKGVAISSSEDIKKVHNSFSRQDAFLAEGKFHIPTGKEEAFHFVAYVPVNGSVYELDGLQKGPIMVGEIPVNSTPEEELIPAWLKVAKRAIQDRIAAQHRTTNADGSTADGDDSAIKFNLMAVIQDKRIRAAATGNGEDLAQEEAKREQWKRENERRRHNYVPLCLQLLRELARIGTLPQLAQEAQEKQLAKQRAKKGTVM